MAQKSNNWLWWTLGSVAFLGVGTGAYLYFRNKKKEEEEQRNIDQGQNTSANQTQTNAPTSPFKNKAEGDAFRNWVNDTHPAYAKLIDLERTGSHTNSFIMKAWNKYGAEYQNRAQSGNTASSTTDSTTSNQNSTWSNLKSQMEDKAIWGSDSSGKSNSRVSEDSLDKLRFGVDVDGFYDIYANFTPQGGFWIEKTTGGKHSGSWSFENGQFTVKLNDGSLNSTDSNIAKIVKAAMKAKYPSEMKYYSFGDEDSSDQNLERTLNQKQKKYVDSQDSML